MKNVLLLTVFLGCTAAFAGNTYRVDLFNPIKVNGTELKAGECKLEVLDGKVIFKQGKKTAELPATIEKGNHKYPSTTVLSTSGNEPREIRISGTTLKITFHNGAAGASAEGSK